MRGRRRRESLPVDTGRQPAPLGHRKAEGRRVRGRPGKATTMQSALTEPDTGAVPDEEFEPRQPPVAEGVGTAVTGRAAQGVLDPL